MQLFFIASLLVTLFGLTQTTGATAGVALVAVGLQLAVYTRMAQAGRQHEALLAAIAARHAPAPDQTATPDATGD